MNLLKFLGQLLKKNHCKRNMLHSEAIFCPRKEISGVGKEFPVVGKKYQA